ncbi:hypothetical protein WMY93_007045 [Mugilogobius chulae]|uniref:C2H2-type domain-containing protein n=1 Tax=Mugilogobius chulae TaxID=88201 RepID=A0AAW0PLS5_9GOBI
MSLNNEALRGLVLQRLAVAADEIFALFERTFAQYEQEFQRSKLMQQPREVLYNEDIQTVTVGVDISSDEPIKANHQVTPPVELQYPSVTLKSERQDPVQEIRQDGEEPGCSTDLILDNNRQPYSYSDTDDSSDWRLLDEKTTTTHSNNNATSVEYSAEYQDDSQRSKSFTENTEKQLQIPTWHKIIPCSICNKTFTSNSMLKQHLISHSKHKPFKCPVCKHRFSQKRHFDEHMRIHTGEKPLSCSECDMRFRQQYSLMRHVLSKHSADKPYRCSFCQKGFVEKWHYEVHVRKHLDKA